MTKHIKSFITIFLMFIFINCGVSRQEYEKLKIERDELLIELDLYKYGESRLLALINQNLESGNIESAKKNIVLLNQYHPESMTKNEIIQIISLVKIEEKKIARLVAEKEAAERAATLERQRGFKNNNASSAKEIDVVEANFILGADKIKKGDYYIVRPGYFYEQDGSKVRLYSGRSYLVDTDIVCYSKQLYRIQRGTRVSVLLYVDQYENFQNILTYHLIELQQY